MTDTLAWTLVAARFALVTLGVGLFGAACFPLYAPWAQPRRAAPALRAAPAVAAAVAALAWIGALAAAAGRADPHAVLRFAIDAGPGRALAAAAVLALALAALALAPGRAPPRVAAVLAGGLLACLAFVGHAASLGGTLGLIPVAIMAAHLLFAGLWLGGLPPLALALRAPGAETERLLRAFGSNAIGAVAALATTGMIAAGVILGLAHVPPGRTYLIAFGVKLALVAALLATASVNRWALTPLAARNPAAAMRALVWTLAVEQLLAVALLVAVARLATLDPGL